MSAAIFYVDANSASPTPPYASWATAAPDIQTAIDAASDGDHILVTNGVYATGGRVVYGALTNRVVINKALTVQSVNGPAATTILGYANNGAASPTNGDNAIRCVYLTNNTALIGFTLAYGATRTAGDTIQEQSGGGAWSEGTNVYLANCIFSTNAAQCYGAGSYSGTLTNCSLTYGVAMSVSYGGGGAYEATLSHCTLAWNLATNGGFGGAAYRCLLYNCLVTSNAASYGSGVAFGTAYNCLFTGNGRLPGSATTWSSAAYLGTLFNCTLAGNSSSGLATADGCTLVNSIIAGNSNGAYADCYQCTLTNCCTPLSVVPAGCITNLPAYVDAAHGNYQLAFGSPGIDAGTNLYAAPGTDLAGNARIFNGTVDMGAYESQFTNTIIHYVLAANATPAAPYTNWLTAATNIQDAITTAKTNEYVVVGAGVFNYGGIKVNGYGLTNRVAITKPITVLGLYGPAQTYISGNRPTGANAVRCAYVTNGAVLTGVTLTNGATLSTGNATYEISGGGVLAESTAALIQNCVFMGNTAVNGGGAEGGTLTNCTVIHNTASYGGGVYGYSTAFNGALISNLVYNCLIVSNTGSQHGGGAFGSTLNNCLNFASNLAPAPTPAPARPTAP